MTRLVIATAFGFMIAQAALYLLRRIVQWLSDGNLGARLRSLGNPRRSAFLGGFIKYASLLGGSAALITFGVWSVEDYMAAKATRTAATLKVPDISASVSEPEPVPPRQQVAPVVRAEQVDETEAAPEVEVDPYADPQFKVQHVKRRAGTATSLKETLVLRSEAKARDDLLRETRQHVQRSQYDCEAAERATRYVRSGLDVWGFAAWQAKYFPTAGYKGATLAQCKDIKDLLDPSAPAMQSAVAQENHP